MKLIYYDLETTGLSHIDSGIHQIALEIVVPDRNYSQKLDIHLKPHEGAIFHPDALTTCKLTQQDIFTKAQMDYKTFYTELCKLLAGYVDKYDKRDKFWLIGYNSRHFDDIHLKGLQSRVLHQSEVSSQDDYLRHLWDYNNDPYFGSFFFETSLDCQVLAAQYISRFPGRRESISNFKQGTVAAELGYPVTDESLHDAFYDIELTKYIYEVCTGLRQELPKVVKPPVTPPLNPVPCPFV